MRTTRVLDLCREAEQSVTDSSEQGHAIRKLAQAIREITEGDPTLEVRQAEREILEAIKEVRDAVAALHRDNR